MNLRHPLILASNSPRRQQLLREAGFTFQVYTEDLKEDFSPVTSPEDVAEFLAREKNRHYRNVLKGAIILTADTTVLLDGQVLNKPSDDKEAFQMLSALSGREHQVITGVCISCEATVESFSDITVVTFKKLRKEEIEFYIETCLPLDKAGAYGIQEWIGMIGITGIKGSYFNVVGLPVHRVYEKLQEYRL